MNTKNISKVLYTYFFLMGLTLNSFSQKDRVITFLQENNFSFKNQPISKITNKKITDWLNSQVDPKTEIKSALVKKIIKNLILNKKYVELFHKDENFIVIPMQESKVSQFENKSNDNSIKFLLLVEDKKGEIRRGDLIFFKPSKSKQSSLPYNSFYNFFIDHELKVDGTFTLISLFDIKQFEYDFLNHIIVESRSWVCNNCNGENVINNERNWVLTTIKFNADGTFSSIDKPLGKTNKNCPPGVNCD